MKNNNSFFNKSTIIYTAISVAVITVMGCAFLLMEHIDNSKIIKHANYEQSEEIIEKIYQSKENSNNEYSADIFGLININSAEKEELMLLPGIGGLKADAIIEYRTNKPFKKIEDVMKVDGISEKTFQKIKYSICVN